MRYPYNGQRQIKLLQPILLANFSGAPANTTNPIEFRVQTPDSRLQTKVSVLFSPTPPTTFPLDISGQNAFLLVQEEDEAYGGPFSGYLPLTTIVAKPDGTPLQLPQNPGLVGYSRELVTAADGIHGYLTFASGEGTVTPGQWFLQVRYQPYGQRLPDRDWEETEQLCNATLVGRPGSF